MKRNILLSALVFLLAGCWGSRYVSADKDLESIYMGKSYYEIVDEFGRPDATMQDNEGGTRIVYNYTSLNGTSAASLYRDYTVRNRRTKEEGKPGSGIVFSFNLRMTCYSVESDLQRMKVKAPVVVKPRDYPKDGLAKPRVPRTLDFPYVERCSPYAQVVSIERVEIEANQTKVYFSYSARTPEHRPLYDKGLSINSDVFIRDCATGKMFKLIKPEGITLYPEYTAFAHNRGGYDDLNYSLTFEALPLETLTIDIVEPGPEGFNFYGVDVRTPMNFRERKQANSIPEK